MKSTRSMVFMGLLIAMEIILTHLFSIQTPIIRIGFGFLPAVLASIMFGPIWGGIMGAVSDILGMAIFPTGGTYFPGFTLSAFLAGVIYGFVLYKKPNSILRIAIATLTVTLLIDLGLNTIWLSMITGRAAVAIIAPRLLKSAAMLPVQIITVSVVWRVLAHLPGFKILQTI